MNILEELTEVLSPLIAVETSVFSEYAPSAYAVLTPMEDMYAVHGDNSPLIDVSEVRISVFVMGNYLEKVKEITRALLDAGFTVTMRRFIEHENDTGYNHYSIDVQQYYL